MLTSRTKEADKLGLEQTQGWNAPEIRIWEDGRKKIAEIAQTLLYIHTASFPLLFHCSQSIGESSITGPEYFEIYVSLRIKIEAYHDV